MFGFHRVPPVVGRYINVTHDVKRFADEELKKTFFRSPGELVSKQLAKPCANPKPLHTTQSNITEMQRKGVYPNVLALNIYERKANYNTIMSGGLM